MCYTAFGGLCLGILREHLTIPEDFILKPGSVSVPHQFAARVCPVYPTVHCARNSKFSPIARLSPNDSGKHIQSESANSLFLPLGKGSVISWSELKLHFVMYLSVTVYTRCLTVYALVVSGVPKE